MPFTFTPGEGGGWVVGTAEPTVPPFGVFTYTIQPVGGWVLEDMTQPATFFAGFASIGPQGPQGQPGEDGGQGPQGPQGEPGAAATVTVGTTTTGAAGSSASVTNSGTTSAAVLNFTIPQGAQGIQGIQGVKGDKGDTGDSGVAYATSPITYDSGSKTVGFDQTAENTAIQTALGNGSILPTSIRTGAVAFGLSGVPDVQTEAFKTSLLTPYALTSSLGAAAYEPLSYWIQSPSVAATDGQIPAWDAATSRAVWIDNAARTLFITAKNQSGATIPARSVVYISGATGANPLISLAKADSETTSATTIGITAADIANGATGQVVTAGLLSKVDTSAWAEGTGLYLSATTAGGFTTTLPVAPNHGVYLGVVTRQHASQGAIEVTIKNYQELEEMSDVLISTPADKNLLAYESSTGLWKNKSFATLDLLTATTAASTYYAIPTGTTAQYIRGNGTLSTFSTDVIAAVPSASTSTAGKVQLATTAEAVAGTDASKAVTAEGVAKEAARRFARRRFQTPITTLATQTSGTGAGYTQVAQYTNIAYASAGVAGFARGYSIVVQPDNFNSGDWSKPWGFGAYTRFSNNAIYAGTNVRCGIGYNSSPTAGVLVGDLTVRGFGFYWAQGGNVFLQVHDGTTLRNIDTGYTPTSAFGINSPVYLEAFSDGAGNVTAYIRVQTYTSSPTTYTEYTVSSANGPTGALMGSPNNGYLFQVASGTTHTSVQNHGGMHPTFFYD